MSVNQPNHASFYGRKYITYIMASTLHTQTLACSDHSLRETVQNVLGDSVQIEMNVWLTTQSWVCDCSLSMRLCCSQQSQAECGVSLVLILLPYSSFSILFRLRKAQSIFFTLMRLWGQIDLFIIFNKRKKYRTFFPTKTPRPWLIFCQEHVQQIQKQQQNVTHYTSLHIYIT